MKTRGTVIGLLAISLALDLTAQTAPAPAQTPPVSSAKPISGYMRDVGLLYLETVERASEIDLLGGGSIEGGAQGIDAGRRRWDEELKTLKALEDRIDIHVAPQADEDFYERGLKKLRLLAETRFADRQSAEIPALKAISAADVERERILERTREEETQYSSGLISTKKYRADLENSIALLKQKQAEASAARKAYIQSEESSLSSRPTISYGVCDGSLRRMIKAGEYDAGELENDCGIPAAATRPQPQAPQPQASRQSPQQQTLDRQAIVDSTNADFKKTSTVGYAEIIGDAYIIHSALASESRFTKYLSDNSQFLLTLKREGIATITYTNDAEVRLVYDVNAGQPVHAASAPAERLTGKEAEASSWHSQYFCEKDHFVWRDGSCHVK